MNEFATRARLVLAAGVLLAFVAIPMAFAGSGDPGATASGTKAKIKKLTKRVAALEAQQGDPRPPTGPAGGGLTGAYPNPSIASGAVGSAEVQDGALLEGDLATGEAGPEAYARVQPNGVLLPVLNDDLPATSKGVDQSDITHTNGTGVYCFDNLGFEPATAAVSLDNANAAQATQNDVFVSVAIERGNNLNGCPGAQARVFTSNAVPAAEDHGFVIWFDEGVPGPPPPPGPLPPED